MAYLSQFDYDVFVSYAHGPRPDALGKWSRRLRDDLEEQLAHRLGTKDPDRQVRIWMDQRLAGNQPITDEIRDVVGRSAVLVVIMSNYFFDTPWCADECAWFTEGAARTGGARDRIFVVRQAPTQEPRWPATLRDSNGHVLKGYPFHTPAADIDDCDTFGWGGPADGAYMQAVVGLAKDISKQLKRMAADTGVERAAPAAGRTAFLGLMHETVEKRDELRTALTETGFAVVPAAADDPVDEASLRDAFDRHLAQADVMVLVVNKYTSMWPKGEPGGLVSLQVDKARELGKPCYILSLVTDPNEVKRPDYRTYLEGLVARTPGGGVMLQSNADDITGFVAHVAATTSADPPENEGEEDEQLAVICHNQPSDQTVGLSVKKALDDALDEINRLSVTYPFAGKDNDQILLVNVSESVREARTVVLLCYDQEWTWARRLVRHINKLSQTRAGRKAKLLILAPQDRHNGDFRADGVGFRTVNGVQLDTSRFKEIFKQELMAADGLGREATAERAGSPVM